MQKYLLSLDSNWLSYNTIMVDRLLPTPRWLLAPETLKLPQKTADVIVVGGGIAGLTTAICAVEQGARVYLATKDSLEESNSFYAQGGVAAVLDSSDSFELHRQDTIRAGDGLCNDEVVKIVVNEGPAAIERLIAYGSDFDKEEGHLALSREGGHSAPRVVHNRDSTGMEIQRALINKVRSLRALSIHEQLFVLDLLVSEGRCVGVLAWSEKEGFFSVLAGCTILTSGGAGQVYRESTNPEVATGDGLAMAFRAGAEVADLEFFQFHPTVLYLAGAPRILISETARGEGGILRDRSGVRFMADYAPAAELAPRDLVSRSILDRMTRTNATHVNLDMTHLGADFLETRFPKIHEFCARYSIDVSKDYIPVRPAAHYMIGGVRTDVHGRTTLPGLFACGEVASSGLHGANRLGSNSLLEGLVFGWRAGLAALEETRSAPRAAWRPTQSSPKGAAMEYGIDVWDLRNSLTSLMWRNVGIVRDLASLDEARDTLEVWARLVANATLRWPSSWELANMLTLSRLIVTAALWRTESRGVHFRKDYPSRNDSAWRRSTVFGARSYEDQSR